MSRPVPYTDVIIEPRNEPQVEHWAKDLQIQPWELREAIKFVGPRLSNLRRYYGKSADIIAIADRRARGTPPPHGPSFL
jgi:hypothetical protein